MVRGGWITLGGQGHSPTPDQRWPSSGQVPSSPAEVFDIMICRCRVEGQPSLVDIGIRDHRIVAVQEGLRADAKLVLQAEGRLASPAFVQPHLHLDKAGVAPLIGINRSGTLAEAISLLHQVKRAATVSEVAARAGAVIRQAVLAGTTFIRSHVDIDTIAGLTGLDGVLQAARAHEDLCDVEVVAFPQEGIWRDPGADGLMRQAMHNGARIVGGMPHWEIDSDAATGHIRFCLDLAREHDADVDMHIDETDDSNSKTFELLLDATEAYGWQGRVTAGHCCAMAAWPSEYTERMIKRAAFLGVNVVTNPATNLLLQGRGDDEPRRRGIPPVKELLQAGVHMACGQDCVLDPFYPFGAADQLQIALILCHAAQLSTPEEIGQSLAMIRGSAAGIVGLEDYGIAPGCPANLIVLDASSSIEALRLQAPRTWVIRAGRLVVETKTTQSLHRYDADHPANSP
jgi:cytosine deaminase